jgi:serine protease Do
VIVTYVDGDSPADAKGIQPGDIITEINHQPVTSRRQFHQALRGADAKKGITFNVISNGSSRLVILQDNDR